MANLAVNGRHVGEHRGGFTGFTFELTPLPALRRDELDLGDRQQLAADGRTAHCGDQRSTAASTATSS
ncbi:MAG: hypothetical protein ACLR8Y_07820 [Alistipes indistinctus]